MGNQKFPNWEKDFSISIPNFHFFVSWGCDSKSSHHNVQLRVDPHICPTFLRNYNVDAWPRSPNIQTCNEYIYVQPQDLIPKMTINSIHFVRDGQTIVPQCETWLNADWHITISKHIVIEFRHVEVHQLEVKHWYTYIVC